jgi:hypothetical protein
MRNRGEGFRAPYFLGCWHVPASPLAEHLLVESQAAAAAAALWRRALAASSLAASRRLGDEQEDLAKGSGWGGLCE